MDRANFTGSPAHITHDSLTWQFAEEEWSVENDLRTKPVKTNLQGQIGEREDYSISTIRGTPLALTSSLATVLGKVWAKSLSGIGTLLFPSTDLPLVIQTMRRVGGNGHSLTYAAAAISQPPELTFASTVPLIGQVEWTCLRKNNTAATDAAAHVAVANSAYSEPSLDPAAINDTTYTMSWGASAPFDDIVCDESGVKARLAYTWADKATWNDGLLNYQLTGVTLEVTFTPVNVDANHFYDSFLLLDGASAGRGKLLSARGQALTIAGANPGDPKLVLANAVPVRGPLNFGGGSRVGSVTLRAQRSSSGGFYTLGVVPTP